MDKNTKLFLQKPYLVPHSKIEAVKVELDRMVTGSIIERSSSPYSNPLVVVIKKDGGVIICLDARINKVIIPDRERTENIEEILKLPFRLNVSMYIFVKCIDQVLGQEILDFATVYVYDILIASETYREHCEQIGRVVKVYVITISLSILKNLSF